MTETKAVPALLRALNERTVLDAVRTEGPISRAEVARKTGISRPTVSLVLRSLLEDGLVRETAHDPDGPHYGAVYYEADPEAAVVLGVDFGARAVRAALCDLSGEVLAREEIRSRGSVEARIDALAGSVRSLLAYRQGPDRTCWRTPWWRCRQSSPPSTGACRLRTCRGLVRPTCGSSWSTRSACR